MTLFNQNLYNDSVDQALRTVLIFLKTMNLTCLSISHTQATAINHVIAHLDTMLDKFLARGSNMDFVAQMA